MVSDCQDFCWQQPFGDQPSPRPPWSFRIGQPNLPNPAFVLSRLSRSRPPLVGGSFEGRYPLRAEILPSAPLAGSRELRPEGWSLGLWGLPGFATPRGLAPARRQVRKSFPAAHHFPQASEQAPAGGKPCRYPLPAGLNLHPLSISKQTGEQTSLWRGRT